MPTPSAAPIAPPAPRSSWFSRLKRARALRGDPARIGDLAVLNSQLLGTRMSARARAVVDALVARRGPHTLRPRIDLDALRCLPPGTFGRAFADFCAANAIVPAAVSDV